MREEGSVVLQRLRVFITRGEGEESRPIRREKNCLLKPF